MIPKQYMILASVLAFSVMAEAQVTFPSLNSSPWLGQEMLGRVESNSVNVNVVFDQDMQVYFEYGTSSGSYTSTTSTATASANTPFNVVLANLQPNTRYYYRMHYAAPGSSDFTARAEHSFVTQRPRGTPFTFLLQADPHMDNNSNSDVYKLTLANESADNADFLVDVGDTMLSDKLNSDGVPVDSGANPTAAGILTRTQLLRSYYDITTHSLPLFLMPGNHEGEWGSHLNGTPNNMAIWDTEDRTSYFPTPAPDAFFTGDTQLYDADGNVCVPTQSVTCGLGERRSYYSWEWGDALFVVLDPFWNQTEDKTANQAGNGQDCCQSGDWSLTLGTVQYNWLKQTLENSTATYKFVFAHNEVGGYNNVVNGVAQGAMRGGVEMAKYLEWGGYNLDGTWGFDTYRPEMAMPIHQLLLANHVTAFFHGHDHLYAHQILDGITYQETPQPSANNATLGTRASDYGYTQGTLLGGRGYLRVTVAPAGVNVQYIETWLPSEQGGMQVNGMVADSYTMSATNSTAPAIWNVTNAEGGSTTIAPNTWVSIIGANLAPAGDSRGWAAADFVNSQLPKQLDGVGVTVNGKDAYVSYISPSQVNILTPPDAMPGSVPVQVTINGTSSAAFTATAKAVSPSFFVFNGGAYVAATHADGSLVGPATLYPGLSTPAKPGETVVLYANGFGATSTPVVSGSMTQSGTLSPLPAIKIGKNTATVAFAGLVAPGQFQFNLVVPASTPDGDQTISATYAGGTTQAGTLLTIQH
jgi:uncharacterized protein (TIGR03437 family)